MAVCNHKSEIAKENFQRAVILATRGGILHEAALANERFGNFLIQHLQDRNEGSFRINAAIRLYTEWGAHEKVNLLRETYARYLSS